MSWMKTGLLAAALLGAVGAAQAADVPGSREYKVLLKPALFADNPKDASNAYLSALKAALDSVGFDRDIDDDFKKGDKRTVRFYDSPGTCTLRAQSYSFRERVGDERESTLKFRSSSQSAAAAVKIKGTSSDAESKFEMDETPPASKAYSRSTKQTFSNGKNLNKMDDVYDDLYSTATGLNVDKDEPLAVVGNLSIAEKNYDGPESDLGQQKADFTVTLWYLNQADADADATPAVAEASFKVKADDGDFTDKVTQRSELIFDTMSQMTSWTAPNATPKTTWVYQYDPSFCDASAPAAQADTTSPF